MTTVNNQGVIELNEVLYFKDLNVYLLVTKDFLYRVSDGGIIRFSSSGKESELYDINYRSALRHGVVISKSEFETVIKIELKRAELECYGAEASTTI